MVLWLGPVTQRVPSDCVVTFSSDSQYSGVVFEIFVGARVNIFYLNYIFILRYMRGEMYLKTVILQIMD